MKLSKPPRFWCNYRRPRILKAAAFVLCLITSPVKAEVITVPSAAGNITVSPAFAPKIQGFIADVVARGFTGRVHCHARGGHVRGSLHYSGDACDFAQRGWNKTVAVMYRVSDLATKWGLRDGCSFRDCGHIDSGARLARGKSKPSKIYATATPIRGTYE